jgi:hypothetical protein
MYQVRKGGTRALPHLQPDDYPYSEEFPVRRLGRPQRKIVQRPKVAVGSLVHPRQNVHPTGFGFVERFEIARTAVAACEESRTALAPLVVIIRMVMTVRGVIVAHRQLPFRAASYTLVIEGKSGLVVNETAARK